MSSPAPLRAAIYVRISRDKTGAGIGVERQEADCRALINDAWQIVTVLSDNDLSAYSGKRRPGYETLLTAIERGEIDRVVTWHTDRLHRSPLELEKWIEVCDPRGVEVHSVKAGPIDLATPSGRAVARTLGAWARYESEHRSERVAAAMDHIAREGRYLGGPRPFGYLDHGMELHPVEAPLVAEGTRMILRGRSLRSVVRMWNGAGTSTTKKRKPWDAAAVRDVLTRERNAALFKHRGVIVGAASWAPIVSEDEWRGVCAILTDPARRTSPGNQPRWLGSGLYRCGIEGCDGRLVVGTTGQQRNPSYLCRASRDRTGGRHVTRAAPALDDFVSDVIIARLSEPDLRELFATARPDVNVARVRAELQAIDEQRTELAAMVGRGEMTVAMMSAANTGLQERLHAQEQLLAQAASLDPVADLVGETDVAAAWRSYDLDRRRAILTRTLEVTVLPAGRGRRPGGTYFDPDGVRIIPIGAWRMPDPPPPDE